MNLQEYKGCTLNERLMLRGTLKEFEKAVQKRDKKELLIILNAVEIENPDIDFILKHTKIKKMNWFKKLWLQYFDKSNY